MLKVVLSFSLVALTMEVIHNRFLLNSFGKYGFMLLNIQTKLCKINCKITLVMYIFNLIT